MQELPTFKAEKISAPKFPEIYKSNYVSAYSNPKNVSTHFSTQNPHTKVTINPAETTNAAPKATFGTEINFPSFMSFYETQTQNPTKSQPKMVQLEAKVYDPNAKSSVVVDPVKYITQNPSSISYNIIKTKEPKNFENMPIPLLPTKVYGTLGSNAVKYFQNYGVETAKPQSNHYVQAYPTEKKDDVPVGTTLPNF